MFLAALVKKKESGLEWRRSTREGGDEKNRLEGKDGWLPRGCLERVSAHLHQLWQDSTNKDEAAWFHPKVMWLDGTLMYSFSKCAPNKYEQKKIKEQSFTDKSLSIAKNVPSKGWALADGIDSDDVTGGKYLLPTADASFLWTSLTFEGGDRNRSLSEFVSRTARSMTKI